MAPAPMPPPTMRPALLTIHRVLAGLGQRELAERSGVPEHEIKELEDGTATAHPLIVRKLAAGLRISTDHLLVQPIEPELLRQLLDGEITYPEFKQKVYGTAHRRAYPHVDGYAHASCVGCGGSL